MARGVNSRRGIRQNNSIKKAGLLTAAVAGVFATGVFSAGPAQAATFTWDTTKSGNWSDPANWGGTAPTGANNTDQLIFGGSGGTGYTSTVDAFVNPWIINALVLNSSATVAETINNTNAAGFQLSGSGAGIIQSGSGAFSISAPIALGAATTLSGNGSGLTTLSGVISGSNSLTVTGGNWRLTNTANSWTGGTTITGGVLELFSNGTDIPLITTGTSRIGTGGSITLNAATPGGAAELRLTSGVGKTNAGGNSRPIIFGPNGGLVNVDGSFANTNLFTVTTSNIPGASPAVFRFNGGPNRLSANSTTDSNWTNGANALRMTITNTGPIRVELNQGAMFVAPNVANLANPLTIRGVFGGDPSSGPNGTIHTGITQNAGRFDLPSQATYTYSGGLTLQDSLQIAQEGAARAIKGNIIVSGTASGHPGNVAFFGRSTGTALGPTLQLPGQTAAGLNPLYIGYNGANPGSDPNDSLTIQDGGIAALDLRVRSDQNNHNGVLLNAKTIINAGGKLVFRQSISSQTPGLTPGPGTNIPVGYHIVQGNIQGEGTSAKDSVIDVYMPPDNTVGDGALTGGIDWQASSNIIVNGSGIGGLRVNGLSRPNALFGGGSNTDPDPNNAKVEGFLTQSRLAALTGTGGYLTPAPVGSTFNMTAGSDWAQSVTVGLRVVNSNTTGDDVALGGNFSHNILIENGATLNAQGQVLGPSAVTPGIGRIWGGGTINGGAIIDVGGRLAPGTSVGTLTSSGDLILNGTYEAEVTDPANDLLNVAGTLTLGANSVLDLPVGNTYGYAPYTIATYGNLSGTFGTVTGIPNGPSGPLYGVDYSNGQIRLVFIAAQQKTWSGSDGTHPTFWDNNTTANWNGGAAKYVDANHDNVTFDDTAASSNVVITGGNVQPSSVLVSNDSLNYTITSSAGNAITGTTGLEKRGGGKLTLAGPNAFTGTVRIKNGTVSVNQLTDGGVAGPLGTSSAITLGDVGLGGTGILQYTGAADGSTNRSIAVTGPGGGFDVTNNVTATFSGAVSGDGALTKRGVGTAALTNAANAFSGSINIEQGTLRMASMAAGTSQISLGNGITGGTLDYSGATFSDTRSVSVNGAGTIRVSNAATNLTLSGNVSGPTLSKTGPGTLTLTGKVNLSDTNHTVSQGTLSLVHPANTFALGTNITVPSGATLQARAGAIGAANVRLTGGVFRASTDDAGLFGEFFLTGPGVVPADNTGVNSGGSSLYNTVSNINNFLATLSAGANALTSTTGTPIAFPTNSAGNGNPLAPWSVSIGNDYVTGRWKGKINLPSSGQYTFYLASDDGSVMFIDGVKVVDLNRLAGYSETTGTPVTLSAGVHDIMMAWYENAGGAGIDASWLPPGGVKGNLPNNILLPASSISSVSFGSNNVQVLNDSTIDSANTNNAVFGALTVEPGITLTHSGIGATRFGITTLNGAGGSSYNFNVTGGILDLGQMTNTVARIINKSGAGNLVLTNDGSNPGLPAGSAVNISGGNVVAVGQDVLGEAPVTLNAGATGLILGSRGGDLIFDNAINVNENVRIGASASDGGVFGPLTVNLTSPITVAGGKTVTLAPDDGYNLNLATAISGAGGISVAAGDGVVDFTTSQTTGTLAVNAGTARITAPQNATVAATVGGFGNGNYAVAQGNALLTTPQLTIGTRGTYNANIPAGIPTNVIVNAAGILNANVANALSGATVNASGGNAQFWVDGAIGTGSVTLSNNGSITGRVAETAADPQNVRTLPSFAVAAGQSGNLAADRDGAAVGVPGKVIAPAANLGSGASLNLVANNNTLLEAQNINLAGGNTTLTNSASSTRVSVGNITGATSNLTVLGNSRTRITGNVSAANMIINGVAVDLDPGTGNTATVNSPIRVNTELKANSGTVNMGNNVLSGDSTRTVPGLKAYFYQLAASEMQPSPFPPAATYFATLTDLNNKYTDTQPTAPFVANTTLVPSLTWAFINDTTGTPPGATFGNMGWNGINNYTVVFRGQILLTGASTQFFTNSDDATMVYLAGNNTAVVDNNGNHGAQARNGTTTLTGWQDVVLGYYAATGTDGARFAIGADADANAITNAILRTPSATGSFGGVVNIESGVQLTAGGVSTLGTINFNGQSSAAALTLSNTSPQSGTVSNINVNGTGVLTLGANNSPTVENLSVPDGAIFEKDGAGTLRVSIGQNLGSGATVGISAGKVLFNGVGSGTGTVLVRSGGAAGGSGSVAGSINVQSGGHLTPGASVGTLTLGGLDLADGALLDIEGGAIGLDKVKIASDGTSDVFTLNGLTTVNLFDQGGVAPGDYVIIDYNNLNPINDALSHLTISNPNGFAGLAASLVNDTANKDIVLRLASDGGPVQWNVDAGGSWGVAGNWSGGIPDSPTAAANFLGKITAPRTITIDGSRTVANLNFDNVNKYTIAPGSGGTLTINAGTINVTSGSHEISAGLAFAGNVTKSGPGTLTISGTQSHSAGAALSVTQGRVNLNSNAGTAGSAAGSNLSLNIGGGAANVTLGSSQDLKALAVSFADAGTQTLDLASPAGAGAFNGINIYAADLNAAKTALYGAIVNANKAGAADPLDGIIDSGLHAGAKIGIAAIGDHVSIRPVRVGDLNLDGSVTISDFIDLASNFNAVGKTWQEGDLNYDGSVTISDFIDLASNFNGSYSGTTGAINSDDVETLASFASSIGVDPSVIGSAVPEPGTLSTLALGAMGLMARRRRRI